MGSLCDTLHTVAMAAKGTKFRAWQWATLKGWGGEKRKTSTHRNAARYPAALSAKLQALVLRVRPED